MSKNNIADIIKAEKWFITDNGLSLIIGIAQREISDIHAVRTIQGDKGKALGTEIRADGTGIINIYGPAFRHANMFSDVSGAFTYEKFTLALGQMSRDSDVKRIILDFDSPGGMVNGVDETANAIATLKKNKPIYAHVSGSCASAAYYLASQTDYINMAQTAFAGSIGVITTITKNDDEKSINFVSKNAENKSQKIDSKEFKASMQYRLDELEKIFIQRVATGRSVTEDYVLEHFGRGDVFIASDAVARKMADSVMSLEDFIISLKKNPNNLKSSQINTKDKNMPNSEENKINVDALKKEATLAERGRIAAIMASPEYIGREALASTLINMDMSAEDVIKAMTSAPKIQPVAEQPKAQEPEATKPEKPILAKIMEKPENNPVIPTSTAPRAEQDIDPLEVIAKSKNLIK